jgi:ankyrin repeat protein
MAASSDALAGSTPEDGTEEQLKDALAAARGDSREALRDLLDESPALLAAHDDGGQTICKAAAEAGSSACLRLCLKIGCNVRLCDVSDSAAI